METMDAPATTETEAKALIEEIAGRELRVADRCDRGNCTAQARCRVIFESGKYLDFCYHDYNEMEPTLEASAVFVVDERSKIE